MVSGRRYGDGLPRTLRPVQYTVAPASPSARAMPRPAPRVAPATSAPCPCNGVGVVIDSSPLSQQSDDSRLHQPPFVGRRRFGVEELREMLLAVASPVRARTVDVREAVLVRERPRSEQA